MSRVEERAKRSERISLRVEPEADSLLRCAATAQHKSLSAFMLDSALERARQVIDEERRLVLQAAEFDRVLEELDRPAQVVASLLRLAEKVARQAELHPV